VSAEPREPAVELLDSLATGIVLLDARLCIVYANVAAQGLLGLSLRQSRGVALASLLADPGQLRALLQRALADGKVCAVHELVLTPLAALPAAAVPAIVDVTVAPLEGRAAQAQLLLELVDAVDEVVVEVHRGARAPRRNAIARLEVIVVVPAIVVERTGDNGRPEQITHLRSRHTGPHLGERGGVGVITLLYGHVVDAGSRGKDAERQPGREPGGRCGNLHGSNHTVRADSWKGKIFARLA